MTPLTLNLLTEEQQAEAASAHDPVKIGFIAGVLILTLTACCGVLMMMWADKRKSTADRLQKRWEAITTKQGGGTFRALKLFAGDLVAIHQRRMLLAPQLARIKDLMPDAIYLTRAEFKMNTVVGAAQPPAIAEDGVARPARAQNVERLSLRLEGTAVGARPEIEVDNFLQALRADAVLSNQVKEITLRSIGRGPATGNVGPQTVMAQFVIECLYKESK